MLCIVVMMMMMSVKHSETRYQLVRGMLFLSLEHGEVAIADAFSYVKQSQ